MDWCVGQIRNPLRTTGGRGEDGGTVESAPYRIAHAKGVGKPMGTRSAMLLNGLGWMFPPSTVLLMAPFRGADLRMLRSYG